MNQKLFCSICVDTERPRQEMAALVADLVHGEVVNRGINCRWARILVDDDYGDFQIRHDDPDDFLGWKTLLEILPADQAERTEVVAGISGLMKELSRRGMRVLAQSDYAEELPGGGEVLLVASE